MRKRGYLAAVVEHWNPHAEIRQDLFGFVDVLAVGENEVVAIQTTTLHNAPDRLRKIREHENLAAVLRGGVRVVVHGWRKFNGRYHLREFPVRFAGVSQK